MDLVLVNCDAETAEVVTRKLHGSAEPSSVGAAVMQTWMLHYGRCKSVKRS